MKKQIKINVYFETEAEKKIVVDKAKETGLSASSYIKMILKK